MCNSVYFKFYKIPVEHEFSSNYLLFPFIPEIIRKGPE